jgi:hypothetical protein
MTGECQKSGKDGLIDSEHGKRPTPQRSLPSEHVPRGSSAGVGVISIPRISNPRISGDKLSAPDSAESLAVRLLRSRNASPPRQKRQKSGSKGATTVTWRTKNPSQPTTSPAATRAAPGPSHTMIHKAAARQTVIHHAESYQVIAPQIGLPQLDACTPRAYQAVVQAAESPQLISPQIGLPQGPSSSRPFQSVTSRVGPSKSGTSAPRPSQTGISGTPRPRAPRCKGTGSQARPPISDLSGSATPRPPTPTGVNRTDTAQSGSAGHKFRIRIMTTFFLESRNQSLHGGDNRKEFIQILAENYNQQVSPPYLPMRYDENSEPADDKTWCLCVCPIHKCKALSKRILFKRILALISFSN